MKLMIDYLKMIGSHYIKGKQKEEIENFIFEHGLSCYVSTRNYLLKQWKGL